MSVAENVEAGTIGARLVGSDTVHRRREAVLSRPAWAELDRTEKGRVVVYAALLMLVGAFLVGAGLAGGLGA